MTFTDNDVESELSYAYLHAVASRAGLECTNSGRHSDNAGVDAYVRYRGPKLASDSTRTDFTLEVQIKATKVVPVLAGGRYSYSQLTIDRYDRLRSVATESQLIMVVFYLPENPADWLAQSEERLLLKRCAYWVSLRGAPASPNPKYQTIYIPEINVLNVKSIGDLMVQRSREEWIAYEP